MAECNHPNECPDCHRYDIVTKQQISQLQHELEGIQKALLLQKRETAVVLKLYNQLLKRALGDADEFDE